MVKQVFSHREESATQLEESEEPKTPESSPNKSGEWREMDSGMEWVINSGKKSTGKQPSEKSGKDQPEKDLDDEETFTNGELLLLIIRCFLYLAQLNIKYVLLINVKMPTVVGIFTLMSRINIWRK